MRALVGALLLLAACGRNPYEATVEGVRLADADKVVAVDDGPVVKLTLDELEPAIPKVPAARVAIARDVTWERVQAMLARFVQANVRPVIVVNKRGDVGALTMSDEIGEHSIHLVARVGGQFCVHPEGTDEKKCVTANDHKHINRAYVRELMREAVKAYQLTDVDLMVAPDLWWVDVVHALDGARTCCKGTEVRVKIVPGDPGPPSEPDQTTELAPPG